MFSEIENILTNDVREFLFYLFLAIAFSYVWMKVPGVLFFIGFFMVAIAVMRIL